MSVLRGGRMKGRGCVDDKALWCVDDRCGYGKQVRGVHATVTSSARCIHVQGNYISAHLVRMVQPWSYTFMHDSTKMHTLVFHSHTHALAHAYIPAANHISLALTLETASLACSFMSSHAMWAARQSWLHMCKGSHMSFSAGCLSAAIPLSERTFLTDTTCNAKMLILNTHLHYGKRKCDTAFKI